MFIINNVNSGKALEVASGSTANRAKLQQNDYTGTSLQQWRVLLVGGGQYVNGAGAGTTNGTSVIQWPKAINFDSASTQTGIRTNLWDYTGADNQLVRSVPQGGWKH